MRRDLRKLAGPFGQGIRDERIAHYTFTKPNSRSVWDNLSSVPKLVTDTTKISRSDTRLQNVYENRFHEGAVFEHVLNIVLIKNVSVSINNMSNFIKKVQGPCSCLLVSNAARFLYSMIKTCQ